MKKSAFRKKLFLEGNYDAPKTVLERNKESNDINQSSMTKIPSSTNGPLKLLYKGWNASQENTPKTLKNTIPQSLSFTISRAAALT
jgi:hypothetical protein